LCALGQPDLAEQLDQETRSGTVLIIALNCCDAHRPDELGAAVTAFTDHRVRVDTARAQWPATG